jgi:GNAT superfamily N-acetyltransferase
VAGRLTVEPERGRADRRAFLGFPYRLYRGHPVWVPPLRIAEAALQDRRKNPFFRHGEAEHFLARRDGRVVGRIAAIENRRHNEFHADRLGFFGWFDAEPDPEAAAALVAAARGWTEARGLVGMRGPYNYTSNDVCGVLVDGFEKRPAIQMPWNRDDYDALLRGAGLVPVKDLLAYNVPARTPPERFLKIAKRALERGGIVLRPLRKREWDAEIRTVHDLYDRSWERNWGYVPMTREEFDHAAKDMKQIVDPATFLIAEREGKAVGFIGALPDVNQALVGLDGRLFPFGLFRLLFRLRRVTHARIMLLGLLPEARGKGVDAAFFVATIEAGIAAGYTEGGEASWILEDNHRMRADLEAVGATMTKRYRLYETPAPGAARA